MYTKLKLKEDLIKFREGLKKLKEAKVDNSLIYRYMDRELQDNLPLFCKIVLPNWFFKDFSDIHFELFNFFSGSIEKAVLAFPRKHGKTTCMKGFVLWCVIYQKQNFIVWVGNKERDVKAHWLNCLIQLETNRLLKAVYGDLKNSSAKWGKEGIKLNNGFRLDILSKGQSLRGILDDRPPTMILFDDIDDDEEVRSKTQRDNLDGWFFNNAIPAIDQEIGKARMIGTCIHEDCQLMRVVKNPAWISSVKSCVDNMDDFNPIWPEFFTREKLLSKKNELYNAKPVPKIQTWWQEWMNQPHNAELQSWDPTKIRWYSGKYSEGFITLTDGEGKAYKDIAVHTFTGVDLASSQAKKSNPDYSVVITAAMDCEGNIYVLRIWRKQWAKPSEIVKEIFEQHKLYKTLEVFVELVACQDFIMETYDCESVKQATAPILTGLRSRKGNKEDRIVGALQNRIRLGLINLRDGMSELYAEIESFPQGMHDDILDGLSDIVTGAYSPLEIREKEKGLPPELQSEERTTFKSKGNKSFAERTINF